MHHATLEATGGEVDRAFRAAAGVAREFGEASGRERAALLRAVADALDAAGPELLPVAQRETALPPPRLTAELARTTGQLRLFAGLVEDGSWVDARIDRADPARTPAPKPDIRRLLVPLGPVAVFGASNFPLAFGAAGGDTASALAAGCPVVCKPHPAHPDTGTAIGEAVVRGIEAAGAPAAIFTILQGWETELGLAMVRHPVTRAVGFTGSLRAGRALADAAASRPEPIPVFAEMGSVNPVFAFPSAIRARGAELARGLAQSISQGVGQFCTNPGVIVLVNGSDSAAFVRQLAEQLDAVPAGTMLYPRLADAFHDGVARLRALGVDCLTTASSRDGVAATLLSTDAATFVAHRGVQEEIFGPVSIVVRTRDVEEFTRVAEALDGQLTASLHCERDELGRERRLVAALRDRVGRLLFNGFPTGVEVGHAMQHGGPYPASTDARTTSVGTAAIHRFVRPVCYQGFPDDALPLQLRNDNPLGILRLVDGRPTREHL